jgi:hypothetical protein
MAESTQYTEPRPVSGIARVLHKGVGNLVVTQGDHEELIIDASKELCLHIKTEMQGDTLMISYDFDIADMFGLRFIGQGPIHYRLMVTNLAALGLSGAGNIECAALKGDRLEVNLSGAGALNLEGLALQHLVSTLSGAGSVTLGGVIDSLELTLSGAGNLDAGRLQSRIAIVRLSGLGSATLRASETLDANVSGAGNIHYYGQPAIHQTVTGLGGLRPAA